MLHNGTLILSIWWLVWGQATAKNMKIEEK